jgi:tRNA (guanine-N(7)-)-methyltransferase subunit TRM82
LTNEDDQGKTGQGMLVCCTGGLTGDAWAFSVEEPGKKRLLLGHTASMLTGIKVLGNSILTSDRDEKIRITSFPDTTIIKGFLFGHEAYISSMDAADNAEEHPICASCSGGDCTVRIWNHETMQLLDTWQPDRKGVETTSTPSRVAMAADGSVLGLIYDQSNVLDILGVETNATDSKAKSLSKSQSIDCSSQPLSVAFSNGNILVLQREPAYMQAYCPTSKSGSKETTPLYGAVELAGCAAIRKLAAEATIAMPDSVLEKDKHGLATMAKLAEPRGGGTTPADQMPWNRSERVDIAKERTKRQRRRRLQRKGE